MTSDTYEKCIDGILANDMPGYSFVEDFVNILINNNQDTIVKNIVTIWSIQFNASEEKKIFQYFSNNQRINLDCFNIDKLLQLERPLSSVDECFIDYKTNDEFSNSHIYIIPINKAKEDESLILIHGVIILFSQLEKINISNDDLFVLYKCLNSKYPNTYSARNIQNAFRSLTSIISEDKRVENIYLTDRFLKVGSALDEIAYKDSKSKKPNHGLRHCSFWKINDYEAQNISLYKEININTFNGAPHTKTHKMLKESDEHYLLKYLNYFRGKVNNGDIKDLIAYYTFNDIKKSFKDSTYFNELELHDDYCYVVIVPIFHKSNKSLNICCFYVKDIVYSVFISKSLLEDFSKKIFESLTLINQITKNNILSELMLASSSKSQAIDFYNEAATILKNANEAEECLIYFANKEKDELLLVTEENSEDIVTFKEKKNKIGTHKCYIPEHFSKDDKFLNFLLQIDLNSEEKNNLLEDSSLYNNIDFEIVYSAFVSKIFNNEKKCIGLVILINKKHSLSSECVFFNNIFIINNLIVTQPSCSFLNQYEQLQISINKKNYLLKKLRHEIPNCTHVIKKNIKAIRDGINNQDFIRWHFSNYASEMELNNSRINLIASFFSTVDYDDKKFSENPTSLNFDRFLNSYINIFREEGSYRGVDISFIIESDCPVLTVSNFYQMAIVNIINNAIRYSSKGTNVLIHVYNNRIEISDIGIPIAKSEIEKIFDEGYRGWEARNIDQRGMGYGLFLAKRIFKAHNSQIEVTSEKISDTNYFIEMAVGLFLEKLESQEMINEYIYKDLSEHEKNSAFSLYNALKKCKKELVNNRQYINNKQYVNDKVDCLRKWIDYEKQYGGIVFLDMQENYFNKEIHKVTFTIYY